MNRSYFKIFMIALLVLGFLLLAFLNSAYAHSWYSGKRNPVSGLSCCNTTDCRAVGDDEVVYENGGYRWLNAPIPENGWIPQEQVQQSHDFQYHVCWYNNTLRCLFIPNSV